MHGFFDGGAKLFPVKGIHSIHLTHHLHQIDGTEVTGFIGQQRLLTAGIGGLNFPLAWHNIIAVEPVEENDTRLPVVPGRFDNFIKYLPRVEGTGKLAAGRVNKIIIAARFHSLHKGFGDTDGNVKIGDVGVIFLAVDKLQDIGMIDAVDVAARNLKVNFDGRIVEYDVTELDELTLAYATTIHKAQGSEYPIVVMPVLMNHFVMLQRNLIYTGITRAKKILVLVGTRKALSYAVRNVTVTKRNTLLKERLQEKF